MKNQHRVPTGAGVQSVTVRPATVRLATVRLATILFLTLLLISLTGCLEVVQHVGAGPGNTLENYVRVTLQRSIFSFAESFGGEAMTDDDFAREFGMSEEEVLQDLPAGVTAQFEPVITEYDYGFALQTSTARTFRTEEAALLPYLAEGGLRIPLPPGNDEGLDEAAFFLASAKYRIMVEKSLLPRIVAAHVQGINDVETPIDITEFQSFWLLEFPVLLWLAGGESPAVVIR